MNLIVANYQHDAIKNLTDFLKLLSLKRLKPISATKNPSESEGILSGRLWFNVDITRSRLFIITFDHLP